MLDYLRTQPCCGTYERTVAYLEHKFVRLGAIGCAVITLVLASLYCVVRIVTVPIVMKHMLTVINVIFVVLGTGALLLICTLSGTGGDCARLTALSCVLQASLRAA